MLSEQQLARFDADGAVTFDTPLTDAQLADLREALDRLFPPADADTVRRQPRCARTADFLEPALVDLMQMPVFEAVAAQVLRAPDVVLNNCALAKTYPTPDAPFTFEQHTDVQYVLADLQARPRHLVRALFIWLADVNDTRAPLMTRPGSHRQIAAWRQQQRVADADNPAVRGTLLDDLPPLDYAPPQPVIARAGQATVLTTAVIHGPSVNVDTRPRYTCHLSLKPKGFDVPHSNPDKEHARRRFIEQLRPHLRPDRQHLATT